MIGIPNLWPFKEALLRKAVAHKEEIEKKKEEDREKRIALRSERRAFLKAGGDLSTLAANAAARSEQFNIIDAAATVSITYIASL